MPKIMISNPMRYSATKTNILERKVPMYHHASNRYVRPIAFSPVISAGEPGNMAEINNPGVNYTFPAMFLLPLAKRAAVACLAA